MYAELAIGAYITLTGKFQTKTGMVSTNVARAIGVGLMAIGGIDYLLPEDFPLGVIGLALGYLAIVFFFVEGANANPSDPPPDNSE